MITRRTLLATGGGVLAASMAGASYAVMVEPGFRLVVSSYDVILPDWGRRPPMSICVIADVHAGEPWMPLSRVERIVATANALAPDLHVVLGDLPAHHRFVAARVPMPGVTEALGGLHAPLGCYAILGNHDWWDDLDTQRTGQGRPVIQRLLARAGLSVLANTAVRLPHGAGVWLAGTDSALAFGPRRPGATNLPAVMAQLSDDAAPAILLAHEPDIFPDVPNRISLTLAGHTHGGQVRLLGHSPIVPSRYGNRYAYGLVQEDGRQMIVSGGLGCSIAPVRVGVPPELTMITVSAPATQAVPLRAAWSGAAAAG